MILVMTNQHTLSGQKGKTFFQQDIKEFEN